MASLFNYNTLNVKLKKETYTLEVALDRPEQGNAINTEMVFELESLLAWVTGHIEIQSILLTSTSDVFSIGLDREEIAQMGNPKLQKHLNKVQQLIYTLFFLPQTVIVDCKEEATGVGAELTIGADIRVARNGSKIRFNHLKKGLIPTCGGVGFLSAIVPPAFARNWVLGSSNISVNDLKNSGYIQSFYTTKDEVKPILENIAEQAPVARIQAKRSFLESVMPALDRALNYESQFASAGLVTEDWKRHIVATQKNEEPQFVSPRELAGRLKDKKAQAETMV